MVLQPSINLQSFVVVNVMNDLPEIRKEALRIKQAHATKVTKDYLVKLSKPAIDLENLSQSPIEGTVRRKPVEAGKANL